MTVWRCTHHYAGDGQVAMMIPVILSWGQRINISASKLMMPLSFAAMIGGMCTTIGAAVVRLCARVREGRGRPCFRVCTPCSAQVG
jgi:hypothetical protein